MQLRSALLAATVLAMPFAASAQPVTGLYVGGGVGLNLTQKEQVKNLTLPTIPGANPTGTALSGKLDGSAGFVGLVSAGWGFGNGLRAELEGNYRYNHISGFNNTGGFAVNGGTNEQKYGPMVNVLYDFNGVSPWVVPYIGAGVGYQWVAEKFHASNGVAIAGTTAATGIGVGGLGFASQHTEGKFAYQAILGAAFPMQVPGLALTAEYRFLGTTGNRTYSGIASATTVGGASGAVPASVQLGPTYNHAILVGLRYNFGVAPPPPPAPAAVPAPAPTRSYLVFFDWDKATLTDRARQIIKEAADNSTKVQYTRIEVNGYTDTSGTPRYNQGLSVRRAKAVQAELVKDGVPQNAITIQGFGDTHLLVPTGPGVREPQNRRVEIIIR
jgi:outer membrane protein OmpA-like peptidoglycan-associated protein/outer membrane protein W